MSSVIMSSKLKRKAPSSSSSGPAAVSTGSQSNTTAATDPLPLVPASERIEADVDFVCQAIESRASQGDYQMARCHLALARCLWRDSFKVRRRAYQLARDEGNWDAAAAAFMQMYADNPNEALFYQELSRVLEGVTKADGDAGCSALFGRLPGRLQCELLLKYGQSVGSALEQASLLLYAIQQYPSVAAQQGASLVEALLAAEQDACVETVLNKYRKCLVIDVLPVLLGVNSSASSSISVQLNSKLLRKLLTMSTEFYVALGSVVNCIPQQQQQQAPLPLIDNWQPPANPWPAGRQLADSLCRQLGMQLHQLARGPPEAVLSAAAGSEDFSETKSLAPVTLLLLGEAVCRFYRLARPSAAPSTSPPASPAPASSAAAMTSSALEAESVPIPGVRSALLLYCLRPTTDKLQLASSPANRREAGKAFLSISRTVRLVRDWPELQRRLESFQERLKRRESIRLLAWLDGIVAEHLLYTGQPAACLRDMRQLASSGVWPAEQRLYYEAQCMQLQGAMAGSVRPLVACCLALSPSDGSLVPTVTADARPPAGTPCLTPLTCGLVLRLLVSTLANLLSRLVDHLGGRNSPHLLIGHCLVLLQRDWPEEDMSQWQQRQLDKLLEAIKERGGLDYPQFADFVILPEAIEELALLRNSGCAELQLFPASEELASSSKRSGSVGNNFDYRMAAQMDRCHENSAELLYQFICREEKSLLEFAEQANFE